MNKIIFILTLIFALTMQRTFAQVISGAEIESLVTAKIESTLDERGDMRRREISFMRNMYDINVPDGALDLIPFLPGNINLSGLTSVNVNINVNGRTYRTISFSVRVRVYDNVLVATHDLKFDSPVSISDFRTEEIVADGRNDYLKDANKIKDLVPVRTIRAGSPVTIDLFQTPMVIESNQPVRIVINYHGVMASAKGVALNRGRIGKMIRVRNENSGKIVSGRIIDSQTVEVIF